MEKSKFTHGPVVVIGGSNIDIQGQSFAPFRPKDSNPGTIEKAAGGVGRNIAESCVRLGLKVRLVTVFGSDADGHWLEKDCRTKGIDTALSLHWEGSSPSYLCTLDSDGSLVAAIADMKAMESLVPGALECLKDDLDEAACIVVDTNIPRESLEWLCARYGRTRGLARAVGGDRESQKSQIGISGPLLFLDPVSETKALKAEGLTGEFHCIKPNWAEARVLAGLSASLEVAGTASPEPEALRLRMAGAGRLPGEVYTSLGSGGIYYYGEEEEGRLPLPPEDQRPKVRNRSGAGDAALAALVWASLENFRPRRKAAYAMAAALLAAASSSPAPESLNKGTLDSLAERIAAREHK